MVALAFPIILLEFGLRITGYVPRYGDPSLFAPTGDTRVYGLNPNWSGVHAGVRVRINSLGLRGAELSSTELDGQYRILVLGDSVVFGHGVEEEDTLTARLQETLQAAILQRRVAVINAGIPGYNTASQLEQLKWLWPTLHPQLVTLVYLADNDSDLDAGIQVDKATGEILTKFHSGSLVSRVSYFIHRYSRLYNFVRYRIRVLLEPTENLPDTEATYMFSSENLGWGMSRRALQEIKALCQARGVTLIVGGVGLIIRMHGLDAVSAFAAQNGFNYVELWRTNNLNRYFQQYAILPYDGHPNAQLNKIMASRLGEFILARMRNTQCKQCD